MSQLIERCHQPIARFPLGDFSARTSEKRLGGDVVSVCRQPIKLLEPSLREQIPLMENRLMISPPSCFTTDKKYIVTTGGNLNKIASISNE